MNKNILRSTFHSAEDQVKICRSKANLTQAQHDSPNNVNMYWQDPQSLIEQQSFQIKDQLNKRSSKNFTWMQSGVDNTKDNKNSFQTLQPVHAGVVRNESTDTIDRLG